MKIIKNFLKENGLLILILAAWMSINFVNIPSVSAGHKHPKFHRHHHGYKYGKNFFHKGRYYRHCRRGHYARPRFSFVFSINPVVHYSYKRVHSGYRVVNAPAAIKSAYSSPVVTVPSRPELGHISVNTKTINVRSAPNKGHPVIAQIHKGDTVSVYEDFNNWLRVKLPSGQTGWIMKKSVDSEQ